MLQAYGDGMMHLDAGNTWHTEVTDSSGLRHHLSAPSRPELAARIGEIRGLCGPGSSGADPQPPPSAVRVASPPERPSSTDVDITRLYDAVDRRDALIADLFGQVENLIHEKSRLVGRLNSRSSRGTRSMRLTGQLANTSDPDQEDEARAQEA